MPRARSHLGDIAVSLGVQDWSFNGHVCSGKVTLLCPFNVKGLCFLTYHVGLSRMTYEKILEGLYRHTQHTPRISKPVGLGDQGRQTQLRSLAPALLTNPRLTRGTRCWVSVSPSVDP